MTRHLPSKYLIGIGLALLMAGAVDTFAQRRDPFAKPAWARTRDSVPGSGVKKTASSLDLSAPPVESRIEYYKRLRETAAANGQPIPKVTSVLTLAELSVTGIFRTPRGYAAMVEADPLKLSYTIYPGEKFFDGQLVAVEENRLVFRKVTKLSNGKFASSVENKALRQYSAREHVQGTAPVQAENAAAAQPAVSVVPLPDVAPQTVRPTGPIVSPLDQMEKQPAVTETKSKKDAKRPAKVAKRK